MPIAITTVPSIIITIVKNAKYENVRRFFRLCLEFEYFENDKLNKKIMILLTSEKEGLDGSMFIGN